MCRRGAQNFAEWLVESLYNFLCRHHRRAIWSSGPFWLFATIFIFILAANWLSLFPGIGSVGWGHQTPEGFRLDEPLFRGAERRRRISRWRWRSSSSRAWIVWASGTSGRDGLLKELFAPKGEEQRRPARAPDRRVLRRGLPRGHFDPLPAGFAELPALRQRLRRREHAGDDGRDSGPSAGWSRFRSISSSCSSGVVQALVFMLLTAVFTLLICQHHGRRSRGRVPGGRMSPH